jgi:hypothetical protein
MTMTSSGFELIELVAGLDYSPTFVSTDKRVPATEKTSLGYYQIGELMQYGFAKGPIFKVEFVDLTSIATATHIKIWGLGNKDDSAPLYPITYINGLTNPIVDVWLKKFEFCDNAGNPVSESEYTVVGHKKNAMPIVW